MGQVHANELGVTMRFRIAANIPRVALLALTIITISVCAVNVMAAGRVKMSAASSQLSEFERQFAEAERLRADAAAAGMEWLETQGLLNRAKAEATLGNMREAYSLLELAVFQAEMALRQAQSEADAWADRVVQ